MARPNKGLPRWVETMMAAGGLVAASPLLVFSALLVRFSSPGPILFHQKRVGRGAVPFTVHKFRTMTVSREGALVTADGDRRITPVGRFLRKTKLDELPELWNVLRGDLSFVGPRPEVPVLVDLDDPLWREVLEARPGITDPVTLALRNEEELLAGVGEEAESFYREVLQPYKLQGYAQYMRARTPWRDVVVIVKTALAVVFPSLTPAPSPEEIERALAPNVRRT